MLSDLHPNAAWVQGLADMKVLAIPNFLPNEERDYLFNALVENQAVFKYRIAAGMSLKEVLYFSLNAEDEAQYGFSVEADEQISEQFSERMIAASQYYSGQVIELLPRLFKIFELESIPVEALPLSIVNGRHGHYAYAHNDESGGRFKISLLYYLHSQPKTFEGGDLEFYPASISDPKGHSPEPIGGIEHQDNLLIAFPSTIYHGIKPVDSKSDNFADGRFSFISFIRRQ